MNADVIFHLSFINQFIISLNECNRWDDFLDFIISVDIIFKYMKLLLRGDLRMLHEREKNSVDDFKFLVHIFIEYLDCLEVRLLGKMSS